MSVGSDAIGAAPEAVAREAMTFPIGDGRLALDPRSRAELFALLRERLADGPGFTLATLNLDHLVKLRTSPAFRRAYRTTDIAVADGKYIVALSRVAGRPAELMPGSELIDPLCGLAAEVGAPVALFGTTDAALATAAARLEARHPGLAIVERISPPHGFDPESAAADAYAARIRDSGARLCFVALGAPKQEIFAVRARGAAPDCGFVSIGAGLDFIAGTQRRAPAWVRRLAFEWLWRALSDPRRLAMRYLRCALLLPSLLRDAVTLRRG